MAKKRQYDLRITQYQDNSVLALQFYETYEMVDLGSDRSFAAPSMKVR